MGDIVVNMRTLAAPATGVQRYTKEVVSRLGTDLDLVAPGRGRGSLGHAWEQTVLPLRLRGRLLFSPGGTGPVSVSRQVVTIHDAAVLDHPEWFSSRFGRWYRFVHLRLLARARRVITVSEFSRRRLVAHVPSAAARLDVIPLAAGREFRPPRGEEVRAVTRRLGLRPPYVLVVGTLQPRKNLERLLAAWREIAGRREDTTLAIVGMRFDDVFRPSDVRDLPPRARLLGYVQDADLSALYGGAAAVVYPSLYEGFGLPALEALACGAAVVAAHAGALPEVVGEAAVLVDPLDVRALAGGMLALLEDDALRERLRVEARPQAARFSWERTAAETRAVLDHVLVECGRPTG